MMHGVCRCGYPHPACTPAQNKMSDLDLTEDHEEITCPRCLTLIEELED